MADDQPWAFFPRPFGKQEIYHICSLNLSLSSKTGAQDDNLHNLKIFNVDHSRKLKAKSPHNGVL